MKHEIDKIGNVWVIGHWNPYHQNWLVDDVRGGQGFGRTIRAAARQCAKPVSFRTKAAAQAEADDCLCS